MSSVDHEFEQDLALMKDPSKWVMVSILPVKNYKRRQPGEFPPCAILVRGMGPVVVFKDFYELSPGIPVVNQVKDSAKEEYSSFEDIINAGWIVD